MKTKLPILVFLFIFTVSLSSGAAMACCWDMEESEHNTSVNSGDDHEPCHKAAESKEKDTEENKQGPNDCCYDMVECQLQLIKITKAVSIKPETFLLLSSTSIAKFNSNVVEPLKHPPKILF